MSSSHSNMKDRKVITILAKYSILEVCGGLGYASENEVNPETQLSTQGDVLNVTVHSGLIRVIAH